MYLLAVNLLEIEDLRHVIKILSEESFEGMKEKAVRAAALLQETAMQRGIELKLRKNLSRRQLDRVNNDSRTDKYEAFSL